jgi:hypothetical protein
MSLLRKPKLTEKRAAASRANGQRSRGVVTPEGKARIIAANLRHGYYSQNDAAIMAMLGEDPEGFERRLDSEIDYWQPANHLEMGLVMRLTRALWRMERADRIQDSLAAEHVTRTYSKNPTMLQMAGMAMRRNANLVALLAGEVGRAGHFTTPEDMALFEQAYGRDLESLSNLDAQSISSALRRLMKPGAEGAAPVIDESDPEAEGTLPEGERREKERRELAMFLLQQVGVLQSMAEDPKGEEWQDPPDTSYGRTALLAPTERFGSLLLTQRMEDSTLRQVQRIIELLTKIKRGVVGPSNDEKSRRLPRSC